MPTPRLIVSLSMFVERVVYNGFRIFFPTTDIFYFGDIKLSNFTHFIAEDRRIARTVGYVPFLDYLCSAEDDGRLFFMPEECDIYGNEHTDKHQDIFQSALIKLRSLGVDVPEWNPEVVDPRCQYPYWRWDDMARFFRGQNVHVWR